LERSEKLKGLYKARDSKWIAQAKDLLSHLGYQTWHRELDTEIENWIEDHPDATQQEFEKFLKELYDREDLKNRFPNGLQN
jgi:poly(3-hydroxyalkanoate) synthetase